MIFELVVRLAQTVHRSYTIPNNLQRERSKTPQHPCHLRVPSSVSKTIFEPMARSTQTVHLSCVKISNTSKWAEMTFPWAMSPRSTIKCVQNNFLGRWYVWRKPWTHLALTITLSPKRKKWDHTWPTSARSSIGCAQNDIRAYVTFNANRSPVTCEDEHSLQTDWNELSLVPRHLGVPSAASKMIF
jgi:hypothetical protein